MLIFSVFYVLDSIELWPIYAAEGIHHIPWLCIYSWHNDWHLSGRGMISFLLAPIVDGIS